MDDTATPSVTIPEENQKNSGSIPTIKDGGVSGASMPGTLAKEIGTGEHAKDSFIWMTLKYCFYIGAILSACIFLAYFHFAFDRNDPDRIDVIAALKDIWSIFTPILTLALGYAFGKKDRDL
ncbi:hypothetical protein [Rahnella sp. NRRL B-41462]|uniref:hypothetical protein n=1 Tax=Rahnella sp. NRRL B-41462 TaxID=1610579 RepID=UPI000DD453F4|nr:hypothetical protein [Rahnella sp. NRRL B-41462]